MQAKKEEITFFRGQHPKKRRRENLSNPSAGQRAFTMDVVMVLFEVERSHW